MNKFEIGEIAVICHPGGKFHLEEVEITSGLIPAGTKLTMMEPERTGKTGSDGYYCLIQGEDAWSPVHRLRKKKPPQELSTWEEVEKLTHWNPTKVYV